jgi:hypothetical protein
MNLGDNMLDRLLQAAARAQTRAPERLMTSGWENRVMAQWRQAATAEEDTAGMRTLRRGLAFACMIALITLAMSVTWISHDTGDEWSYARISVAQALNQ